MIQNTYKSSIYGFIYLFLLLGNQPAYLETHNKIETYEITSEENNDDSRNSLEKLLQEQDDIDIIILGSLFANIKTLYMELYLLKQDTFIGTEYVGLNQKLSLGVLSKINTSEYFKHSNAKTYNQYIMLTHQIRLLELRVNTITDQLQKEALQDIIKTLMKYTDIKKATYLEYQEASKQLELLGKKFLSVHINSPKYISDNANIKSSKEYIEASKSYNKTCKKFPQLYKDDYYLTIELLNKISLALLKRTAKNYYSTVFKNFNIKLGSLVL